MNSLRFVLLASCLIACGFTTCRRTPPDTRTVVAAGAAAGEKLGTAAEDEVRKAKEAEEAIREQASKVGAEVNASKFAAGSITAPEDQPAQKAITDSLAQAQAENPVAVKPEHERKAMERVALNLQKKFQEADALYNTARTEADAAKAKLATAEKERDEARAALPAAIESARLEREAQKADYENRLKELKGIADAALAAKKQAEDEAARKQREKFMTYLSWGLLGAAFLCALGAVATMYVSKGTEWQRAAILGACGSGFGVCYWTVNQWWFKWAVIGTIALVVIAVILYVWTEAKTKRKLDEKQAALAEKQADLDDAQVIRNAAKKFIRRLDSIKGKNLSGPEWDAWLESLRGDMEKDERDVIHELRAEANISTTP